MMEIETSNTPIIGIDLDDVMWDLLTAWVDSYNEKTGDDINPYDVESWDVATYMNKLPAEELFGLLEQKCLWDKIEAVNEAGAYLKRLMTHGYIVYIVTATRYRTIQYKIPRMFELFPFIKENQLIITQDKRLLDLDILVDDNPENLCNASYDKLLFSRPHNKWCKAENIGATRVGNWEEIYDYIIKNFPIEESVVGR